MIFLILFIILLGYAIYSYNNDNKKVGLLVYFFFVSNGFYLIPDSVIGSYPINKLIDFGTIYLIFVTCKIFSTKRYYFRKIENELKWWKWLFFYLTFSFLWTVALGKELFGMSLAMYRTYFCFLSFILFLDLKFEDLRWIFKKVIFITTIATILYVLQPLLKIKTLSTGGGISEEAGTLRYRNIPYLTYFLLIYYTIILKFSSWKKIILLLLCIISLILTQHRGIMLGYAITILIYLLLERKMQKALQFGLIGLITFLVLGDLIFSRFKQADTKSDFKALTNLNYKNLDIENDNEGGTLTFRILLLIERGEYLLHTPTYTLQGVGMRHEDSPKTQKEFNFVLGSLKKKGNEWTKEQISTGDLVWMTPLIKFGFIGISLYLIITYFMSSFFYKNKKNGTLIQIAFYYYLLLIIISFKNDQLFSPIHIFMIFLLHRLTCKKGLLIRYKNIILTKKKNEDIHSDIL